jgi:thymidylate synthase
MNNLDRQYTDLLKTILEHGVEKKDRTGTGTKSIFGYTIRHNMQEGFPLLTTKKMPFKTITTELLWFLRGDTNIKFLVDNNCHIWDGDAYKNYEKTTPTQYVVGSDSDPMRQCMVWKRKTDSSSGYPILERLTQEEFINKIKTDDGFAKKWGELGPIYGKQWREWKTEVAIPTTLRIDDGDDIEPLYVKGTQYIDQIQKLVLDIMNNPDSRRLMVSAWNVGELDQMVLPPCHYGFQVYTRELSYEERCDVFQFTTDFDKENREHLKEFNNDIMNDYNTPTRAISLMWNQRSVDTFLGLPFNIASYGLLLEIIAKAVNMVPDQLIGNLGDTHLYLNHIEQAEEQVGREMTWEEQVQWVMKNTDVELENLYIVEEIAKDSTPKRTRQPYPLPRLNINTEFWPYKGGECGEGPLDAIAVFNGFRDSNFCKCLLEEDIQLDNYRSHPAIKAPLSN